MTGKSRLTLHQPERREALKKTAALGAAAVAPLGFPAIVRGQADTIKLGHITPRTGFLGQLGEYGFRGSSLAVEEINGAGGVLGRKLEVVAEDSVNPQTAVTKAQKLIERDKVVALIGEISSASGLAIGEQALRLKTPYFNTGCNSDELRGKNCNRFMFHIEGCNTMYTKTIGSWQKAQNKIKGANWYMLTADYAFGHDLYNVSSRFLKENGGTVVANDLVPTNSTDSGMMLLRMPPLIAPTETTAGYSVMLTWRLTIVCSASTICEAVTMGSTPPQGREPCVCRPLTTSLKRSDAAISEPSR